MSSRSATPSAKIPRHVGIIMDGNGRWATARGLNRSLGHAKGSSMVKDIILAADRAKVEVLSLYCFSTENWKRPAEEIAVLMDLMRDYLLKEREHLIRDNVLFRVLGEMKRVPANVAEVVHETQELTRHNTGLVLNFCFSYGGRREIVLAMQALGAEIQRGQLTPADITEELVANRLFTAGLPDPDLIIRTSGEFRSSNFLLWQSAYAEYYITETLWPDFGPAEFAKALDFYAQRVRRFGQSDESPLSPLDLSSPELDSHHA